LRDALTKKASALQAEGDATNASLLRGFSFHPFRIAIIDVYYSQVYVGTHEGAAGLATEMVDFLVENFYLDKLTTPELVTDALVLCYARAVGDKYASYDANITAESEETEYVGIGVTVELLTNGYAKVIEVANASPAEEAGIRLGDILVAVEGEDFAVLGYDNAVSKIRGIEGTAVTVTVERDGSPINFTMIRKKMTVRSVSFHMVEESEEKIGYIRITKFDGTTFSQFVEAVETLESQEVTSFVFDVRQNPGGRLDVIIAILDYILPDGTGAPIVRLQYRYQSEKIYGIADCFSSVSQVKEYGYTAALNHSVDQKMTVLCDAYTVSAAELFTSCLKDFGVAEVFGNTTYGKGMGQTEYSLPYSYTGGDLGSNDPLACIRISTFYYSPPVSQNYESVGVMPHHTVTLPDELRNVSIYDLPYEADKALQAAVAFIESGAPLTEGKVDLTPNEGDGDSGNGNPSGDNGGNNVGGDSVDDGNGGDDTANENDGSNPSKPKPPSSDLSKDESQNEPHSPAYVLSFWIVFSVLATTAAALFAVGVRKWLTETDADPLPAENAPTGKNEASEQDPTTDTPNDTPEL
jgi:carboxyl-terminal processing protease